MPRALARGYLLMRLYKKMIHQVFRKTGYDFLRYSPENFVQIRRIKTIRDGKIDVVVDVGASEGYYVRELRDSGYRGRAVSFEPLLESFSALMKNAVGDDRWICINAALGQFDGESEIFVSGHKTSSSLLPMTNVHLAAMPSSATVQKQKVKLYALDSFLGDIIHLSERIFLKLDVQGYETLVLAGATQTLNQVYAIELELSLKPLYQGAPDLHEMMNFLEALCFAPVSFNHVFSDPISDHLLQMDGIFVRNINQ